MSATRYLLPEFEQEMRTTRRPLERVREERLDWQPRRKSYTLRQLVPDSYGSSVGSPQG